MVKKICFLGILGLLTGLTSAFAEESAQSVGALAAVVGHRFSCTYEGPALVGKGVAPLVCTAFGDFTFPITSTLTGDGDHLTVICGNTVLYSDGVLANFATTSTVELRSVVPLVANLTIRTLTPSVFTGPLGSVLRLDVPGTPPALLTGVCRIHDVTLPAELN